MLTAARWSFADLTCAHEVIRDGKIDLLIIGRPTLADSHWLYYTAMISGENAPPDLMPD